MDTIANEFSLTYSIRIEQLLTRASQVLVEVFEKRWKQYTKRPWVPGSKCGAELTELCKNAREEVIYDEVAVIKNGLSNKWDISAANTAIRAVTKAIEKGGGKTDASDNRLIRELVDIRNEIKHSAKPMTANKYRQYWNAIPKYLVRLGDRRAELDQMKNGLLKIGAHLFEKPMEVYKNEDEKVVVSNKFEALEVEDNECEDSEPEEDIKVKPKKIRNRVPKPVSNSEYMTFMKEAQTLLENKNLLQAISILNKILELPDVTVEDQAQTYVSRCEAYFHQGTKTSLSTAMEDAKLATQQWPCWWKGYFWLGKVQKSLQNIDKAEEALKKAAILNPTNPEVQKLLDVLRAKDHIVCGLTNYAPQYLSLSEKDLLENAKLHYGMTTKKLKKFKDKISGLRGYGDYLKGNSFRDKKDYFQAAKLYTIAAENGSTEGMFELAMLCHEGKGVQQDYHESKRWLQKILNSKAIGLEEISCLAETQHMIGYRFSEGRGEEQNYTEAAKWYQKAVNNYYVGSANNLAILYLNGQGVTKSVEKAEELFKLGARLGNLYSMLSLAILYLEAKTCSPSKDALIEGIKWLKLCADKGHGVAEIQLEDIKKLTNEEMVKEGISRAAVMGAQLSVLNEELYGKAIIEACKNGSATAEKLLEMWTNLEAAAIAFKSNDFQKFLSSLAAAISSYPSLVEIPEIYHETIENNTKNESNLDAVICYVHMKRQDSSHTDYLTSYITKVLENYPDNEYLLETLIEALIRSGKIEEAQAWTQKALMIHPKSHQLLYLKAMTIYSLPETIDKSIPEIDAFLAVAPVDHDKVPDCHYRKALHYAYADNKPKFIQSFEAGLSAEKQQLPCFLPYKFLFKEPLSKLYSEFRKKESELKDGTSKKPSNKPSTQPPTTISMSSNKKLLILKHRELFIKAEKLNSTPTFSTSNERLPQATKCRIRPGLKSIVLRDMIPDKKYEGYVLEAKVIEWSFLNAGVISTIIQDGNGDVQKLEIYNHPLINAYHQDMVAVMKEFNPGCTVSIINPSMKQTQDEITVILTQNSHIFSDKASKNKFCHSCWKDGITNNQLLQCPTCLIAFYCSQKCLEFDKIDLKHQEVCQYLSKYADFL